MPDRLTVVHLVDDATAGGVMRVVDHILTSSGMGEIADHKMVQIARGRIAWRRFDADVIVSHLSVSWRNIPVLMALRAASGSARFYHVEHTYTESFVALNVTHRRRFETLLRVAFALFDKVIAVSDGQAAWLRRRQFCSDDKLSVIQSCVDLDQFRAVPPPRSTPRVFGAIGRFDRQKGFDTLIQAFRKINDPGIALHLFGQGDQEQLLRSLAAGDARIVFRGFASDPVAAYAEVDVVVMPSRWEAYGLVAIEALAAGRPVLCANVDGMKDHEALGARLVRQATVSEWQSALGEACRPRRADQLSPVAASACPDLAARFRAQWGRVLMPPEHQPS